MATAVINIQQKSESSISPYEELIAVALEGLNEDPLVALIKARNIRATDGKTSDWMRRPATDGPPAPTIATKKRMRAALGEINSRVGDGTLRESDINSAYREALRRIAADKL